MTASHSTRDRLPTQGSAMSVCDDWKHRANIASRRVVAIGNFDGVHRGHQTLLACCRTVAAALEAAPVALTFDPHPKRIFCPDAAPPRLSSVSAKVEQIAQCGMAGVWVQRFDRDFAAVSAEDFVEKVLRVGLGMVHVVVGEDYRFGAKRRGDVSMLRRLGAAGGFGVTVVAPLRDGGGEVISSTRVRAALGDGRIGDANAMLGRPWEIEGRVSRDGDTMTLPLGDYQRPGSRLLDALVSPDHGPATPWNVALRAPARLTKTEDDSGHALCLPIPAGSFKGGATRVRVMGTLPEA